MPQVATKFVSIERDVCAFCRLPFRVQHLVDDFKNRFKLLREQRTNPMRPVTFLAFTIPNMVLPTSFRIVRFSDVTDFASARINQRVDKSCRGVLLRDRFSGRHALVFQVSTFC